MFRAWRLGLGFVCEGWRDLMSGALHFFGMDKLYDGRLHPVRSD